MSSEAELDALWAQSAEPQSPVLTVTEARELVKADPKYKAAVVEGPAPLTDHAEECKVRVFKLLKTADAYFRQRLRELEEQGYTKLRWGITHGVVVLEGPEGQVGIHLDRKRLTTRRQPATL